VHTPQHAAGSQLVEVAPDGHLRRAGRFGQFGDADLVGGAKPLDDDPVPFRALHPAMLARRTISHNRIVRPITHVVRTLGAA
jgi:hypothetical protein